MTVKQLLRWIIKAHRVRESSQYDVNKGDYCLCLKQSLLKTEPQDSTHGHYAGIGEKELAIAIAYTFKYLELCDWEDEIFEEKLKTVAEYNLRKIMEYRFALLLHDPTPEPEPPRREHRSIPEVAEYLSNMRDRTSHGPNCLCDNCIASRDQNRRNCEEDTDGLARDTDHYLLNDYDQIPDSD